MNLATYLGLLRPREAVLAETLRQVGDGHAEEPDVRVTCLRLAAQCDHHEQRLDAPVRRYGEGKSDNEPERLHAQGLSEVRNGPLGLLRDLQDVHMLATFIRETWTMIGQAGQALRDESLLTVVGECSAEIQIQIQWLETRMKQAAPQALVVAER